MDEHQDSPLDSTQTTAKKKVRGPTRMKNVTSKRLHEERLHVDIDEITKRPMGDSATEFMSTMGVLARTKVSILLPSWDHVEEVVKNHIWADITETWDIPRTEDMRRKTLSIVDERWRAYKTSLTNNYIFGKKKGEFPGYKNPTIDQETWNAFVESIMTKEFLEKRKKAQEIQDSRVSPHSLCFLPLFGFLGTIVLFAFSFPSSAPTRGKAHGKAVATRRGAVERKDPPPPKDLESGAPGYDWVKREMGGGVQSVFRSPLEVNAVWKTHRICDPSISRMI
ncbi:uncharacterized protein LOC114915028 [Cajanus cajan]|uniref:uncharacterized protein LOC114915028 n=1 Tax=Cajanus cajan TaxID=3821 RepID=UPI0010FAE9CF|nr:uncharacterized protein LOC114915028 [Cajanus cajan]